MEFVCQQLQVSQLISKGFNPLYTRMRSFSLIHARWINMSTLNDLTGEPGLLVGKITVRSPFVGYVGNEQQTEKKRLRDVFVKGDLYFNSGDLLKIDHEKFVYFHDRVGDTFR